MTEEEEAEEEQIQLERSHSSARGQPAGQLGRAVSFSSSAAAGLAVLSLRRRSSRVRADHLSVSRSVPPPVRLGLVVCLPVSAGSRNQMLVFSRLGKPGSSAMSLLGADPFSGSWHPRHTASSGGLLPQRANELASGRASKRVTSDRRAPFTEAGAEGRGRGNRS